MRTVPLALFLFLSVLLQAPSPGWAQALGSILTVAGTGAGGYNGEGHPATNSQVDAPDDLAFDSNGNYYIADAGNLTIRRVDILTGVMTTVVGTTLVSGYTGDGGPATSATLDYPSGIAFDSLDNMYISDFYNNVVRRVDAVTGIITPYAGNGTYAYSGDGGAATSASLAAPLRRLFDGSDNLYIADSENHAVRRVDAVTGVMTTVAGAGVTGYSGDGGLATAAQLNTPAQMDFDPSGNLYISDSGNFVIRRVDAGTGVITTVVGNGTAGYSGDGGPATGASLNGDDVAITIDRAGNFFIADDWNNVIRRVDAFTGIITTVAGTGANGYSGDGGPPLAATFAHPETLHFDGRGSLYVVQYDHAVIRRIDGSAVAFTPTPTPSATATPTATVTATPTPPPPDIFYVDRNLFRPDQGPVSIFVEYHRYPGAYSLAVYNTAGEQIVKLDERPMDAPVSQSYLWDGRNYAGEDCASGVYILHLIEPYSRKFKRIALIR